MQLPLIIAGCLCFIFIYTPGSAQKARVLTINFIYDARANSTDSDTVFHNAAVPITSADFTGQPSRSGRSEAVSFTSFAYEGSSRKVKDTLVVNLQLQVFMVKSASWIRGTQGDRTTLEHEQLHFDITRVVGERFRKKILSMPLTIEDYDSMVQYEYLESFREMNRMQNEFDRETNNGQHLSVQYRWRQDIHNMLAELGVTSAH